VLIDELRAKLAEQDQIIEQRNAMLSDQYQSMSNLLARIHRDPAIQ
jgi:uncharacterized coiled-coil protein SlyX